MVKIYTSGVLALLSYLNVATNGAMLAESKLMFAHLIILGRVPFTNFVIEFEYIALPILAYCLYYVFGKLYVKGKDEVKRVALGAKDYLETISI